MVTRQTLLFFLFAVIFFQANAQKNQSNLAWQKQKIHSLQSETLDKNGLTVNKFQLFRLDKQVLAKSFQNENFAIGRKGTNTIIIPFPNAEGILQKFSVKPSNTLHPELVKKFPHIRTFEGVGLDDPSAVIRFELGPKGLTAMIWSSKTETQVIQPMKIDNQSDSHIVYYKKSANRKVQNHFTCYTDHIDQSKAVERSVSGARFNDGQLRTYRLALATTAEYTALFGGTSGAMAALASTINRVNGILKRDVAVELQLVSNNDQIIFTNSDTDGYTNDESGEMLDENQVNIDNIIGNGNYDIGHVFSTGNGGVAYLGSVCLNAVKAGGVTGSQLPQGDVFDVDYVTHEIGHQLGANHTQNNDCSSSFATSVEPGSGSTIMGYAGICTPNVQNQSDDYFHAISISQIKGFTTESADNCAIKTPTNNSRPTAIAGSNYTIPHSTPFELVGNSTDADNDALTYTWEQMDNQAAPMPPLGTSSAGPLFRSVYPSNSPERQFPAKGINKNHTSTTWEQLPQVERTMKFQFTVRDNFSGGGNTAHDDVLIAVDGDSGPFKITAPNGNETLSAGISQEIKWDVAGSNQSPVNCSAVDIYLSVDGGESYSIVLAENVDNNGSAFVTFPISAVNSNARIKIKGRNNVFFDVSDSNFQISQAQEGFDLVISPNSYIVCPSSTLNVLVKVLSVQGFNGTVFLSAVTSANFASQGFTANFVNTDDSTSFSINIGNNLGIGNYDVTIKGNLGDLEVSKTITISVVAPIPPSSNLIAPEEDAIEVNSIPSFSWTSAGLGVKYQLEVASDASFSNLIYTALDLETVEHTLPISLGNGRTYFWRVQTANQCGQGEFSSIRSFKVTNNLCQTFQNLNEFSISSGLPSTTISPIIVTQSGIVNSVKVTVNIEHSWINDLTLTLESPSGKKAKLLERICGNQDLIQLIFGNEGSGVIPCDPPVSENIFAPAESFDIFSGDEINGTWRLLVSDGVELDGGIIKSWTLELCRDVEISTPLNILISNTTNPTCNGGNTGSIQASIIGGTPDYSIEWSNGANQLALSNLKAGIYGVTVTDGKGAKAFTTAVLEEPSTILVEEIIENISCNGENNGSIQVFPSGGTPGYTYHWANGVRQFNNLNLPDGNYEVTITDGNNCTKVKSFIVTEPTPIELSFVSSNAVNGLNGSIDLEVTGGTGEYSYIWSSGANTRDVDGLAPGNFTVLVTDENGCSIQGEFSVITENTGEECYNVTINITLDNYGSENSWELKDANGQLIQKAGPFNNFEDGSIYVTKICLPPGCYDFSIFDLWGDGMCCAYGQGGYEVVEDATGEVLVIGGSFNKSETKNFCVPSETNDQTVVEYCGANGRNTQYEWIETVEIAGQVFNSGDDEGYGDYSNTEVSLTIGQIVDFAFTPGFGFFEYNENWQMWIDFNGDGDFEDDGENPYLGSGNNRITGSIGIPADATPGKTRMRIAMKWGALITSCESFSWGEVEDYTLELLPSVTIGERINNLSQTNIFSTGMPTFLTTQARTNIYDISLFPNPSSSYLMLNWEAPYSTNFDLLIFNSLGQLKDYQSISAQKGFNNTEIKLQSYPEGVYLLQLRHPNRIITKEFVVTK